MALFKENKNKDKLASKEKNSDSSKRRNFHFIDFFSFRWLNASSTAIWMHICMYHFSQPHIKDFVIDMQNVHVFDNYDIIP